MSAFNSLLTWLFECDMLTAYDLYLIEHIEAQESLSPYAPRTSF